MDKRKSDIHEHQSAIDELEVTIEHQTAELGRLILQSDSCETEEIREPFSVGKQIQTEIAEKESRREEIRNVLERTRQLEEQLHELDEEDKTFEKSRAELVGSLGAHGYRVYRTGSLEDEKFDKVFEEINAIDAQLSEKERLVQGLSVAQDEKNLFQKLPGTAKIAVLKSTLVRLEKKRDTALARAGEQLIETGKVEDIPDEQLRSVTSNIKQQEDRREERVQQREDLTREKEQQHQKLESLAETASPEKALKQLENEISRQQERLYEQQLQVGKAFLLQPSLKMGGGNERQAVLTRIQDLELQKQQYQNKVNRLQAELEIEELQDAMKRKEDHIARLEKKIAEEKQEVEQIRDDLSADTNRIKELRRMVQSEESPRAERTEQVEQVEQAEQKAAKKSSSTKKKSAGGKGEAEKPGTEKAQEKPEKQEKPEQE